MQQKIKIKIPINRKILLIEYNLTYKHYFMITKNKPKSDHIDIVKFNDYNDTLCMAKNK